MQRIPMGDAGLDAAFPRPRDLSAHYAGLLERLSELKATRRSMMLGASVAPTAKHAFDRGCCVPETRPEC